jgi:hypothetical protein
MDYRDFKKWDLENKIPGLVNNFWMLHPQVILTGMSYWLHYNVDIKVPFKWNAVDFQCPYTKPPIVAPKGDHYKEMTMIEVILKRQEFIDSPPNKGRHTAGLKENIVKYPPKIVKLRKQVTTLSEQIERMEHGIISVNRHLKKLKTEGSNEDSIKNVYSILIAAKREAAQHKKERKECKIAIDSEFLSIQMSVDLAKQEYFNDSEAEKDAALVEAMLARFSTTTAT